MGLIEKIFGGRMGTGGGEGGIEGIEDTSGQKKKEAPLTVDAVVGAFIDSQKSPVDKFVSFILSLLTIFGIPEAEKEKIVDSIHSMFSLFPEEKRGEMNGILKHTVEMIRRAEISTVATVIILDPEEKKILSAVKGNVNSRDDILLFSERTAMEVIGFIPGRRNIIVEILTSTALSRAFLFVTVHSRKGREAEGGRKDREGIESINITIGAIRGEVVGIQDILPLTIAGTVSSMIEMALRGERGEEDECKREGERKEKEKRGEDGEEEIDDYDGRWKEYEFT